MIIDNQDNTLRIYRQKMFMAIAMAVVIVLILTTHWFDRDLLGITKSQWIIGVAGIYILLVSVSWMRQLNYFAFDEKGDKLLFRYYPIRPLGRKRRAIQIPKTKLAGYDIRTRLLGLRRILILHQHMKAGKTATYPPIGITTLTSEEVDLLREYLDRYSRK